MVVAYLISWLYITHLKFIRSSILSFSENRPQLHSVCRYLGIIHGGAPIKKAFQVLLGMKERNLEGGGGGGKSCKTFSNKTKIKLFQLLTQFLKNLSALLLRLSLGRICFVFSQKSSQTLFNLSSGILRDLFRASHSPASFCPRKGLKCLKNNAA